MGSRGHTTAAPPRKPFGGVSLALAAILPAAGNETFLGVVRLESLGRPHSLPVVELRSTTG